MSERASPEDLQKAEAMKLIFLRKILSKPAMERLARIKLVKPEAATQLENYLLNLFQAGKIRNEISEEQMKTILETISGGRNFKIVRK